MYDLNFGIYLLYTWCTREWFNRLGRAPIYRDILINDMFFQYISYAYLLNNTNNPGRPGVRCMTSALECTCCTRGVQENYFNLLCRTPICRDTMINHMFRNTFPIRDYSIIPINLGDQE